MRAIGTVLLLACTGCSQHVVVEGDGGPPEDAAGPDGDDGDAPSVDPSCLCFAGEERFCVTPDTAVIGTQACNDLADSWGPCGAAELPVDCAESNPRSFFTARYQACLIDSGFCVQDVWDFDRDGDTEESLGECGGIACFMDVDADCPPGVASPSLERMGDNVDNDCDGVTDECDVEGWCSADCLCMAGAWRYCDEPAYGYLGRQDCAPNGDSWQRCSETSIPQQCEAVESWYSPELESCMISEGFCVQDMWDLDHDGDTWESLGACDDITCAPWG